jgi:hypothetical protein
MAWEVARPLSSWAEALALLTRHRVWSALERVNEMDRRQSSPDSRLLGHARFPGPGYPQAPQARLAAGLIEGPANLWACGFVDNPLSNFGRGVT